MSIHVSDIVVFCHPATVIYCIVLLGLWYVLCVMSQVMSWFGTPALGPHGYEKSSIWSSNRKFKFTCIAFKVNQEDENLRCHYFQNLKMLRMFWGQKFHYFFDTELWIVSFTKAVKHFIKVINFIFIIIERESVFLHLYCIPIQAAEVILLTFFLLLLFKGIYRI